MRQHNVSDYLPRHLTVNIPERKTLRKEERETLLECELCKKYFTELTARYSADLNKLAALKSKKLCLFIVGKDVVISYFHCLENHRKKNNLKKKKPLTKLPNILLYLMYAVLRNGKKRAFKK